MGKTSILKRHFNNKFDPDQKSTVNPNYYEKKVERNGNKYAFCFWDTAGQEKFDALNSIYYNGAIAALIVYDVFEMETFTKVKKWVNELRTIVGPDTIFVVAGNKFDKLTSKDDYEKSNEIVKKYIEEENVKHFYTSAKSGENLNEAFECVVNLALAKAASCNDKKTKGKGNIKVESGKDVPKKKGDCC